MFKVSKFLQSSVLCLLRLPPIAPGKKMSSAEQGLAHHLPAAYPKDTRAVAAPETPDTRREAGGGGGGGGGGMKRRRKRGRTRIEREVNGGASEFA